MPTGDPRKRSRYAPGLFDAAPMLSLDDERKRKAMGISPEEWLADRASWETGAPAGIGMAKSGLFADEDPVDESAGLLAGVQAPPKRKRDTLGIIGATLRDVGAGLQGREAGALEALRAREQEDEMDALLGGMELSPEEQALVRAGEGRGVLAQRMGDRREQKLYDRNRADTVGDMTRARGWDVEDREAGQAYATTERQAGERFAAGEGDKDRAASAQQFWAKLKADKEAAAAEAAGGGVFDGPQLASIYNNSLAYIDAQEAAGQKLNSVAKEAGQFVSEARGYDAQGKGLWNDIKQMFSMKTSGLERHTKALGPLMREAGAGSMSDGDRKAFEESGVNVDNTPASNQQFELGARLTAARQSQYVAFLRENISAADPASRQEAQALWDVYTSEVPLFDPNTRQPRDPKTVPDFETWLESKLAEGGAPAAAAPGAEDFTDDDEARYQELLRKRGGR